MKTKNDRRRASRTGRSSTGKLASFTDAPRENLTVDEYTTLENLISEAADSDRALMDAAKTVGQLRQQLSAAEGELANTRAKNTNIRAAMAPLFHRLPA